MLLLTQIRYIYQPQTGAILSWNNTKMYKNEGNINNNNNNNIIKTLPRYNVQHKTL
jgi:hypothetical protein